MSDLPEANVRLTFNPAEVPEAATGRMVHDLSRALVLGTLTARDEVVDRVRAELREIAAPTSASILRLLDEAWVIAMPRYAANIGPLTAAAYYRAFRQADAGVVPSEFIEKLAQNHVARTAGYFQETSAEALTKGFNSYVNQQMPARAAADRVLTAYGLTEKQMTGYVAASGSLNAKVTSSAELDLGDKVKNYVVRSLKQRLGLIARQEDHNVSMEAQQVAWLWMQEKGTLPQDAVKMWITAEDEKVCKYCGPLHGKQVRINEQFSTGLGDYWVPGLHPNCRCIVRLVTGPTSISKVLEGDNLRAFNREHPRAKDGRFGVKARTKERPTFTPGLFPETETETATETATQNPTEAPVETPTIHVAAPVKVTTPIRVATAINVQTPIEVRMTNKPVVSVSTQLNAALNMATINALPKVQLSAASLEALKVEMDKPAIKLHPVPYRETKVLENPVYAVYEMADVDENNRISLDYDTEFYTSFSNVATAAQQMQNELIDDWAETQFYSQALVQTTNQATGERLHATLNEDEWRAVANYAATKDHPNATPDAKMIITWHKESGTEWGPDQLTLSEIATSSGVNASDFTVHVLRMHEGHDSDLGETEIIRNGTRSSDETWVTRGYYDVSPAYEGATMRADIKVHDIVPEVETQTMYEPEGHRPGYDDWTEPVKGAFPRDDFNE